MEMSNDLCPTCAGEVYIDGQRIKFPGPRTDEVYVTGQLPLRFMYPSILKGYRECEGSLPHPSYRSTSMDYGWCAPSIHTVPTTYYPRKSNFSTSMARGGMYQNRSLNTELDKSIV